MKGTIFDFLKLTTEKPELAKELVELAIRHDFVFTDEVSDEELENVAGGTFSALPRSEGIDTNAYMQSALREAYMEQTANLANMASRLEYFNAPKETDSAQGTPI